MFSAMFIDEDCRFAAAGGKVYPVLLTSCKRGDHYAEDTTDQDYYPAEWCAQFQAILQKSGLAVLASDADPSGAFSFVGIYRIEDVRLTNFLTCRVTKRIRSLKYNWG